MSQRRRICPSTFVAAAACFALITSVGCVGSLDEKPLGAAPGGGGVDAGPGQTPSCDEPIANTASGRHHAGEACLVCHTPGGGAPTFSVGGTLYDSVSGGAPIVGATVHVIDANGTDVLMTSAENGNFWTKTALTFPVKTFASSCPDRAEMITPVSESDGDCNSAGCHTGSFRVHLP